MSTGQPKCCGFKLECLGYTMAGFSILKCIVGIIIESIFIGEVKDKEGEIEKGGKPTACTDVEITLGAVGVGGVIGELIFLVFAIIGIYLPKPWMLIPWMIVNVINVVVDFATFIHFVTRSQCLGVLGAVYSIVAVITSIFALVVIVKLYKWLRRKNKEEE